MANETNTPAMHDYDAADDNFCSVCRKTEGNHDDVQYDLREEAKRQAFVDMRSACAAALQVLNSPSSTAQRNRVVEMLRSVLNGAA